jgi:hypothetical protein
MLDVVKQEHATAWNAVQYEYLSVYFCSSISFAVSTPMD